jgi:inner membrane protein
MPAFSFGYTRTSSRAHDADRRSASRPMMPRMPTILTHALLPLAAGIVLGRNRVSPRLVAAGMAAAMLPDADVAMFALGIDYAHAFGHRGASHSLVFALACGLLATCFARTLKTPPITALFLVALSATSHPLLDMLTDGGLGVALYWPWSDARHFAPWRVIEVSPFANRFFSARGLAVLRSEFCWVWLPTLALAGVLFWIRVAGRSARPRSVS